VRSPWRHALPTILLPTATDPPRKAPRRHRHRLGDAIARRPARPPRARHRRPARPRATARLHRGAPFSRSAYTWHAIALSEDHALNAIATGTLDIPAPDGSTIELKYDHAVDHGDGNWTWVGRPAGAKPGTEAIITFGPKAVFGTVPTAASRRCAFPPRRRAARS
jgi:hypothetical protein